MQLAEYDAAHAGAGDTWSAAQTFALNFDTSDFGTVFQTTTGTEGSLLSFEIAGVTRDLVDNSAYPNVNRGSYVDNIVFSTVDIPEPASAALVGMAGFALAFRRCRK